MCLWFVDVTHSLPTFQKGKHTQHPVQPTTKEDANEASLKKKKYTLWTFIVFSWFSEGQDLRICGIFKYEAGEKIGGIYLK